MSIIGHNQTSIHFPLASLFVIFSYYHCVHIVPNKAIGIPELYWDPLSFISQSISVCNLYQFLDFHHYTKSGLLSSKHLIESPDFSHMALVR